MAIREINEVLTELYETTTTEEAIKVLKIYADSIVDETGVWLADDPFKQLQIVNRIKNQIV